MANDIDRNRIPELWDSIDLLVPDEHLAEFRQLALALHDLYASDTSATHVRAYAEGFQSGRRSPFRDCRSGPLPVMETAARTRAPRVVN
jgi:hypothetical protein